MHDVVARQRSRALFAACSIAFCAACSGGGGSSAPDYQIQFTSSGASVVEGGAPIAVGVELVTSRAMLPQPVSFTISALSSSSAVSGADFAPLPEQGLTFPAGAHDGDVQSITMQALDDTLVEGANETVRLALAHASGPGGLGARRTFTLSIVDDDLATVQFASAASATPDEATADFPVAVELSLPPGASLASDLKVRVTDAGTGSATKGHDYSAFAATTITIPAGTLGGALFPFELHVKQDSKIEGDESVVLALAVASPGVTIGNVATHVVTITDDDSASLGVLDVFGDSGPQLSSGATLDLGAQSIAAGPDAGLLVHVLNAGSGPLAIDAPLINGGDERDFSVVVDASTFAMPPPAAGLAAQAGSTASPLIRVADDERHGATLSFDGAANAGLAQRSRVTLVDFALPGADPVALELERVPSPWTGDARLVVDGVDVAGGAGALLGDLTLWRGRVAGESDSNVFLALSSSGARGWVQRGGNARGMVHILALRDGGGASVAVREDQLASFGVHAPLDFCSTPETAGVSALGGAPGAGGAALTGASTIAECRMALESDYQLFQNFGSSQQLVQYVTELVAAASARYRIDVQAKLSIAYLGVHSQANDGWNTPDTPGTSSQMLDEFQHAWAGAWPVSANLAHFLSGANLGGGVAYVGVLCDSNFGFAVSGNLNLAIDWSTWTGASGPLTWDFVVFAHETGHNFGASHTHAYCPPLDQCYSNCTGMTVCSQGTLMSYCHLCAGGMSNIDLVFHPFVANVMRGEIDTSCLDAAALAPNEELTWRVQFDPDVGAAPRHSTMTFGHDAHNAPTPFTLELVGSALP
jgi:hypothetical protein